MRISAAAVYVAAFLVGSHFSASAQSILVQVSAAESGNPLPGVFVSLLSEEGLVIRSALTNESGGSVLPLSQPGTFRVKAELIGRETQVSSPVVLGNEESVTIPLAMPVHAVALAAITVEANERCELRPDEASEVARVWEEARKPLAMQAWAEREGLYRHDISTYVRDLDGAGRKVEHENRRGTSRVTRVPFASLPAEDLMRGGFVRVLAGGGYEYYGPDAALLLSDLFLDSHCFRLTRSGDRQGAIGLAFEPARAGELPDITGILWVDEESAALRLIEYHYTWAPYAEADGIAGGLVEFARLPNGAWLIERWWIRAPILARHQNLTRAGDSGIRVAGIRETGGEVVGVSTLDKRRITQTRRGSILGLVWDSAASAPLAGATVYLAGTQYRADTDTAGRFVLDGLPAGVFTAGFTHPRVDSLGIEISGAEVEVTPGRTTEVALAVPSSETILLAACRAEEREEGGAVVSGVVRDQATGEPLPGARIRVEWQEVQQLEPILQAKNRWFEVRTDREGFYTACGIPVDTPVRIRASLLTSQERVEEVSFTENAHRVDLELRFAPGVLTVGWDTVFDEDRDRRGGQGVQGRLVELGGGRHIGFAEITIRSGSGRVLARGTTDDQGLFRLQVPQGGRFLFSANALGYKRIDDQVVEVEPEKLTVLEVQMAAGAVELAPIVVTTEARSFRLEREGFYRRRAEGLGFHIPPEVIEQRRPQKTTDLFFGIPRTRVIEPAGGGRGRAVRFTNVIEWCWPMVYVDRHLVSTGGSVNAGAEPLAIDDVVSTADIFAIEVFRSPAEIPSEFNGPNAGCGVVVLWTRRGGGG
jgi:hypothetical protein